jgi:hypothetical protein
VDLPVSGRLLRQEELSVSQCIVASEAATASMQPQPSSPGATGAR